MRGTLFGGPCNEDPSILGSILRSLILGSCHTYWFQVFRTLCYRAFLLREALGKFEHVNKKAIDQSGSWLRLRFETCAQAIAL